MFLKEAYIKYFDYIRIRRLSDVATRHINQRVQMLIDSFSEDTLLENITHDDVQAFFASDYLSSLSRATYNHYIANIRDFFTYFHQRGDIRINPAMTIRTVEIEQRIIEYFTLDEFRKLLNAKVRYKFKNQKEYNARNKMLLLIAGLCGLRNTEVRSLQWKHINFEYEELTVRQGKNRKDRIVPLPRPVLQYLREEYKRRKPDLHHYMVGANCGNTKPAHLETMNETLRDICKAAGVRKDWIHFHMLRHTCATLFLRGTPNNRGMDIRVLKDLLGHVDIKTTMKYTHVEKSFLRDEMKRCLPTI